MWWLTLWPAGFLDSLYFWALRSGGLNLKEQFLYLLYLKCVCGTFHVCKDLMCGWERKSEPWKGLNKTETVGGKQERSWQMMKEERMFKLSVTPWNLRGGELFCPFKSRLTLPHHCYHSLLTPNNKINGEKPSTNDKHPRKLHIFHMFSRE